MHRKRIIFVSYLFGRWIFRFRKLQTDELLTIFIGFFCPFVAINPYIWGTEFLNTKNMKRKPFKKIFFVLAAVVLLTGYYGCAPSEDYITEQEVRVIIREELRNFMTEDQIRQLINNSITPSVSEDRVKQIIAEELKDSLTPAQIQQIIDAVGPGLTEEQIRQIIKEEVDKVATGWEVIGIHVKKEDWKWSDETEQYEVVFDLPELTEFIYEKGAALGYVFIGTQGVDEVQKPLPFVFTYKEKDDKGDTFTYTETVSCDFQLGNPSTVAFFIQASDRYRADENLADYNFRVVLIY